MTVTVTVNGAECANIRAQDALRDRRLLTAWSVVANAIDVHARARARATQIESEPLSVGALFGRTSPPDASIAFRNGVRDTRDRAIGGQPICPAPSDVRRANRRRSDSDTAGRCRHRGGPCRAPLPSPLRACQGAPCSDTSAARTKSARDSPSRTRRPRQGPSLRSPSIPRVRYNPRSVERIRWPTDS